MVFLNCVLSPKLFNIPLASCFLKNLNFVVTQMAHFDNSIVLLLLVFETLGFMFSVFFYTLNNMLALFYTYVFCLIILSMPFLLPSSIRFFFSITCLTFHHSNAFF